jgi:hypothetical protein
MRMAMSQELGSAWVPPPTGCCSGRTGEYPEAFTFEPIGLTLILTTKTIDKEERDSEMNASELLRLVETKSNLHELKTDLQSVFQKEIDIPKRQAIARAYWAVQEAEVILEELLGILNDENGDLNS